jgi:hypothetical protein
MTKTALFLAPVLLAATAGAALGEQRPSYAALPDATILPANVVQVSPVVPAMGEHWADPATLPLGPIYCVHEGKVVCLEFMMSQEDFADGKSWPELAGLSGLPAVDHVDIGFQAHGHEGFETPHYDIHMFFIPREDVLAIR